MSEELTNVKSSVSDTPELEKKPVWSDDMQAEFDKRAARMRNAAEADGYKKARAEFEAKQAAEKDAVEKARLADEGKYKDVAALADTAKSAAEKRAEEAEKKAEALALQMNFDRTVRSMAIEFVNEKAEEDAFAHLDLGLIGEDKSGMAKAIEQLQKDRPYYFGSHTSNANTDADQRGKRQTNQKSDEERNKEIIQRFNLRRPR